jgi:hypothetical protein
MAMRLAVGLLGVVAGYSALRVAVPGPASAQEPVRVLADADLPTRFDTAVVGRYLEFVAGEIGRLAPRYPQLADWTRPKGDAWESPGLRRTRTTLEYGHALTTVRNRGLNAQFGAEGLRIDVHIHTPREFLALRGAPYGTVLHGEPLGGGCAVATVVSMHPRDQALERDIERILRRGAGTGEFCTGPMDRAGYILLALGVPLNALDSTASFQPFSQWLAEAAGTDTSRIVWEVTDCGEGGDGREAPTCVEAGVPLPGNAMSYVNLIVADQKGVPSSPAVLSAFVPDANGRQNDVRTLSAWAAAVRARRRPSGHPEHPRIQEAPHGIAAHEAIHPSFAAQAPTSNGEHDLRMKAVGCDARPDRRPGRT